MNFFMYLLNDWEEKRNEEVANNSVIPQIKPYNSIYILQLPMVRRVNRKRVLCTTTFFYESLMRLKSGQKEFTRKIVAAHIKVAYLWQFNCKYKYGIY